MKTAIYLFLLAALPVLANPVETVTVSGKVTNTPDNKLSIRGESFLKEISLKPDGSFSEILNINYNGTYTIATSDNRLSIYLAKGTKLSLTANNKDFYKSMVYTGKGSVENNYIVRKTAITIPIVQQEMYTLGEKEFLAKLNEIKTSMTANFTATKFEDADFKKKEAQNIYFFEQLYFRNYPTYHAHYAKLPDYKPTAEFPKLDPLMSLDDEQAFLFSNPYKQIVTEQFTEGAERQMGKEDQYMAAYALPEIKKLKSQSIKNALSQLLSYEISPTNPNGTDLYNQLMEISTNPFFEKDITEKYNKTKGLIAGKPSPVFDYENHKGGKTSLESLKGSYVYVDVWATWCGPCRQEIPSLQKVEQSFEGKNIKFVSISVDTKKDHEKWAKMVTDKSLGGIQLFADNDWNSQFVKEYAIDSIPRFIIIAPDGTILNADAPRPSDPKLTELLGGLKI
jgi:thiol-disulfide isomerase/thioredoxin